MTRVLFVCSHNAGRSQMREALFAEAAEGRPPGPRGLTRPAGRLRFRAGEPKPSPRLEPGTLPYHALYAGGHPSRRAAVVCNFAAFPAAQFAGRCFESTPLVSNGFPLRRNRGEPRPDLISARGAVHSPSPRPHRRLQCGLTCSRGLARGQAAAEPSGEASISFGGAAPQLRVALQATHPRATSRRRLAAPKRPRP